MLGFFGAIADVDLSDNTVRFHDMNWWVPIRALMGFERWECSPFGPGCREVSLAARAGGRTPKVGEHQIFHHDFVLEGPGNSRSPKMSTLLDWSPHCLGQNRPRSPKVGSVPAFPA